MARLVNPQDQVLLARLRAAIGHECSYGARRCRIVEVLAEAAPATAAPQSAAAPGGLSNPPPIGRLILEVLDVTPPIQLDQYGHAAYRANDHLEILVHGGRGASDELSRLLDDLGGRD